MPPPPRKPSFRSLDDFAGIASDWFWETDADNRFCYFSARMEEVTRLDVDSIMGKTRAEVPAVGTGGAGWIQHLDDMKNRRPFQNFEYMFRRPSDGSILWIRASGIPRFDASGKFKGYRGTGQDITAERLDRRKLEDANKVLAQRNRELQIARRTIENAANEDALTRLPNRRCFERDLKQALLDALHPVALMHIDLDRFKWINDTFGHPVGDDVLREAATRISEAARRHGQVYRVGGDEFTIILPDHPTMDVTQWVGDAIVEWMAEPIFVGHQRTTIGASVGFALSTPHLTQPADLIAEADTALYEAKRAGRGTVCHITEELQEQMALSRQLAADIQSGLANGEFIPFFQPQIDMNTGDIIGAEALVRWRHPKQGILGPNSFLDVAAGIGFSIQIDKIMLLESLKAIDRLAAEGLHLPSISVNISEARLLDPQLIEDIKSSWRHPSCQLTFELLETLLFDDSEANTATLQQLNALRKLGIRLESDDFGSGHASMTALLQVRPDGIKIDKGLVQASLQDRDYQVLVGAIIEMASKLGLYCIAEGVETQSHIDHIADMGCRIMQGYAIAPPLSEADFADFLRCHAYPQKKASLAGPP